MGWRSNFKRRSYTPRVSTSAIAAPVAYASTQKSTKAQYVNFTSDSCRVKHCELLGSVTGSNNFVVDINNGTFQINPGLVTSFPWLSSQAAAWEKYKFHNLRFIYHTKCSTSVPGSVLLGLDYDASDVAPTDEKQLSSFYGSVESAPWKEIVFQCDMKRMADSRYIRVSAVTGVDIKTYDQGNFYVGTVDGTAVPWGKLWVEYDVELQIPQQNPPAGIGVYFSAVTTTANLFPVINNTTIQSRNYNISVNGSPTVANRLVIDGLVPGKRYAITLVVTGTVITAVTAGITDSAANFGNAVTVIDGPAVIGVVVANFQANIFSGNHIIILDLVVAATTVEEVTAYVSQIETPIFP